MKKEEINYGYDTELLRWIEYYKIYILTRSSRTLLKLTYSNIDTLSKQIASGEKPHLIWSAKLHDLKRQYENLISEFRQNHTLCETMYNHLLPHLKSIPSLN